MSTVPMPWSWSERILLVALILLTALTVVRLAHGGSHRSTSAMPLPRQVLETPPETTKPLPGPAGAEVVARIRTCSERDLERIVERVSPSEAAALVAQLASVDRQAVLAALPVAIVTRKAKDMLGVPEAYFQHSQHPGDLATSLLDIALGSAAGRTDAHPQELVFSSTLDAQGVPLDLRKTFRSNERRIHACLDGTPGTSGVLVRWTRQDTDEVIYLHYLPLTAERRWNHVYFEVAAAWTPGAYRVRFYRLEDHATCLMAEGGYVVDR